MTYISHVVKNTYNIEK